MKFSTATTVLTLLSVSSTVVGAYKIEDIADESIRRRLDSKPHHMKMKAQFHMTRQGGPTQPTQDLFQLPQGNRLIECDSPQNKLDCSNMDMLSYLYNTELGCNSEGLIGFTYINDLWGWNDPSDGKEYALVGMFDGTSFVDITDPVDPVVLGFMDTAGDLPAGDFNGFWRDIKVINDVAYIGAEVAEHGVQVFDLSRLKDIPRPGPGKTPTRDEVLRIEPDSVLTGIGSSHNIVGFADVEKVLAVGIAADATDCDIDAGESVAIWDVSEPLDPVFEGCISGKTADGSGPRFNDCPEDTDENCSYTGYVHDGQCFVYDGPDGDYTGTPICVFFTETEIVIVDMESEGYPIINQFSYPAYAYVHQGWFSEDHTTLYANDELDELFDTAGINQIPRTLIFDLTKLDAEPPLTTFANDNPHPSIDHNMYVKGDLIYSANYEAGSRIYKINSDYSLDEVAYFDISTVCDDIENCDDPFGGSWTHFPYFDSGNTIGCNGFEGFYIFKPTL